MAPVNVSKKQLLATPRAYYGELRYSTVDEHIEVSRFIARGDEVSFDLSTEWGLGGHWRFCGVAKVLPGGAFLSEGINGRQMIGNAKGYESRPVRFRFEIKRQSDSRIQISGTLFLQGEEHTFSGTLKHLTLKNRS